MRVVFFGTPDFAVPSLRALIEEGAEVSAVITQPDRPQGRSRSRLVAPPVKVAAEALKLPVLQPERPRGDLFLTNLRRLTPDLGVVVAYGHLLRPEVLAIPHRGMLNVHASLLPRHRGAAPVQAALLAGDRETGVSIMQMDAGLDTGPVLHRAATLIHHEESAGELTERLAALGAKALIEALVLLQRGELRAQPQDVSRATYAPKVEREQARIDWNRPAELVARTIRAFDPWPGAWTTLEGCEIKLFGARSEERQGQPGELLAVAPALLVGTSSTAVAIDEVQPAGRRRMGAPDWARGHGAVRGMRFE